MSALPPLMRDQRAIDADHLALLAIFHFIFAGFALIGLGFLFIHYLFMHAIFTNPDMWHGPNAPPREQFEHFFGIFKWFYLGMGTIMIAGGVTNLLSGLFIQRRVHRTFSIVIAALNCLQIPFGTVLGIFTLVVLLRESVWEVYAANARQQATPAG
jgi:hypothetical protein